MSRPSAALAAALYLVLAVAFTWPLLTVMTRALPEGHGDPLLNSWILAWDSERVLGLLQGRTGEIARFWQANIFHPEKDALAYSEHLLPQALLALPVYAATGNVVLGYNLVFLSTFVLTGLGVFLLVRELTRDPIAAFLAGVVFAFLPLRVDHLSHLQVLSTQWMPLVLFGVLRYLESGRPRALLGAAGAWLLQGLSSGYYLLFFPPFLGLFVLFELHRRRRLVDLRAWRDLVLAGLVVAALTAPFLLPYARVRARGEVERKPAEVAAFSADVHSYWSADENLRLWGKLLPGVDRNEAQLFPGLTPILLCAAGALLAFLDRRGKAPPERERLDALTVLLLGIAALQAVFALLIASGHPPSFSLGFTDVRILSDRRAVLIATVAFALALVRSAELRRRSLELTRSVPAFFVAALLLAVWLSFGPVVHSGGWPLPAPGLYRLLYDHVPGYDGLRVPARMAMVGGLFLAVLAGLAAAALRRRSSSPAVWIALPLVFLAEGTAVPIPLWPQVDRQADLRAEPAVYAAVQQLPPEAVLVELPFGDPYDEVKYVFHSTRHWRPLLNGYSGAFPASYRARRDALGDVLAQPDEAWTALSASGATHVVVHEDAWRGRKGKRVTEWLEGKGARRVGSFLADVLLELPKPH